MQPVYLDHNATTPIDPRVLDEMLPYMKEMYGNAGSAHIFGRQVREGADLARTRVADLIGAQASEICFTSGATESNNMAIIGLCSGKESIGKHIITTKIEHKAVLEACRSLESSGFEVTYLDLPKNGVVELENIRRHIRSGAEGTTDRTALISIMAANNEIGTLNPIDAIGDLAAEFGIPFHVDAAQMVGKLPLNAHELKIDYLSLSGHKLYGPKGVGALFCNRTQMRGKKLYLSPLMHGGGQEGGLRPGTQAVYLCVGLGKACEVAAQNMTKNIEHVRGLRDRLWQKLKSEIPNITMNGCPEKRLPGNLNACFPGIDSEILMLRLTNVALSTGSACSEKSTAPSYVLSGIGLSDRCACSSLRFGVGKNNTETEIDFAAAQTILAAKDLAGCQKMLLAE